ncbi:uncharacterized protein [Epargyreus clarus]|uniref:uncharacterized protein n=1 Tax=Epargyreus clarus TaxID=520877 RepID=UPI003C2C2966
MPYPRPLTVITMIFLLLTIFTLGYLIVTPTCGDEISCPDGRLCPSHWNCCELGCCAPTTGPSRFPTDDLKVDTWYYQWPVLFLLGLLGGILVCCTWSLFFKRGQGVYMCSLACCVRRPTSERDSAGSVYPPPRYSRCGSIHQAPPPYSEVTSKPDMYPLVITCAEGDGKSSGNYLMVQYFRNYVIRPPGSLSATSTAESLSSSFICNAANEANSIVPPPYSCASNYDEGYGRGRSVLRSLSSLTEPRRERNALFRDNLLNSPIQPMDSTYDLEMELIDIERYCDGACKPRVGNSPPPHSNRSRIYENEPYESVLRHLFESDHEPPGVCQSPPQPTSPTQTSNESTLRRPSDERRQKHLDNVRKTYKARKSSLYMPLSAGYTGRCSRISPGTRASSRSAPATPCGVPNLFSFSQRVSASRHSSKSSRLEEENDPLLADVENPRTDHKF